MPHWLTGTLTCLIILFNTLIGIGPMLVVGLLKVAIPLRGFQRHCSRIVMWIAETWAAGVNATINRMTGTQWDIRCEGVLAPQHSYLVISNHQSWVDIPALLQAFNRKTPYFKFFLKRELVWIPFLGLAFWALDYPFMKRYSKAHLARFPEDQGKDLEITRRACRKFNKLPVTIVNYLEGTRLTPAKHRAQNSPYRHLLKPKSGGVAFVMAALGEQMRSLLDVTIVYPQGKPPGFWALLSGRVDRVVIDIRQVELAPELFAGDYQNDVQFRNRFQKWVNDLWQTKDERIEQLHAELLPYSSKTNQTQMPAAINQESDARTTSGD
ncbi:acyltransferase [Halopseudomonas salina]|uniref:Acyltransferase n=1 Tax=Halopseudomonas salina TaxID=1323744 RepID=A0ABQ1PXU3_9GAMM|nr:acyltransferase [Halopseudomonas salina]GGD06678.1 acyltransferase [Halopseudomonas salina]